MTEELTVTAASESVSDDNNAVQEEPGVLIRQYGLGDPTDWGDDCQEHLWLCNKLWNRFVEIEQENRKKYLAILRQDEELRYTEDEITALQTERAERIAQRNAARAKARSKSVDSAEVRDGINDLNHRITKLAKLASARRRAIRPVYGEQIRASEMERRALVKLARQQSGLWWSNYNMVQARYEKARSKAMKDGAELRFHSFDGTGQFRCQIQGGMSVNDLFAGRNSVVQVDPVDPQAWTSHSRGARRRLSRTHLTITVYTGTGEDGKPFRRTLRFPMVMHRPIPDDARIKELFVTRKRVGTQFVWSVTFTTRASPGQESINSSQTVCAVDLGWRKTPQGLRVATALDSTEEVQYVILPNSLLYKFEHANTLKSRIDDEVNTVQTVLREKSSLLPNLPDDLTELLASALRPRPTTRRLAKMIIFWRDNYPGIGADVVSYLEEHRKHLKRLQNEMDNLRDKALHRRQDFYRKAAIQIVQDKAMVLIEDFDLRGVTAVKQDDGAENDAPEPVRRMRQVAAVSELRKWIVLQAAKHGTRIDVLKSAYTTRRCSACDHLNEKSDPYDLVWKCPKCGNVLDQDINACRNLLADAKIESGADPMR